ncbi:hypothetical protein BATDEDRAFT_21488 [Batrachochytrium dendrobatidis JAM81]|uniref:Uncharacterized protein n=1 Tax=Batrachochytrium dendrobatidis (strain JAM81 / FGSC 10211) TaxID=684364 RepID=F4NTF8_BATDJ|nr:uncharacterized protein BATDEDRAFT_21488 [Batrachochytrium dendrobatidis JAM81]EGF83913.1 hypothetical protein BATDEDRAFT_21488 [Batrachochytrium dendrobatidis JAM81]|eukprot:XP_006675298.1 hypothetical protein BATDEDRAFT_21488 [Batrachochytrium dendrobatidis JAM81]
MKNSPEARSNLIDGSPHSRHSSRTRPTTCRLTQSFEARYPLKKGSANVSSAYVYIVASQVTELMTALAEVLIEERLQVPDPSFAKPTPLPLENNLFQKLHRSPSLSSSTSAQPSVLSQSQNSPSTDKKIASNHTLVPSVIGSYETPSTEQKCTELKFEYNPQLMSRPSEMLCPQTAESQTLGSLDAGYHQQCTSITPPFSYNHAGKTINMPPSFSSHPTCEDHSHEDLRLITLRLHNTLRTDINLLMTDRIPKDSC